MEKIWILHEARPDEVRRALMAELMEHRMPKPRSKKGYFSFLRLLGKLLLMPVPYAQLQILLISAVIWLYAYLQIIY